MDRSKIHPERVGCATAALALGFVFSKWLLPFCEQGRVPATPGVPAFLDHNQTQDFITYVVFMLVTPVTAALLYRLARKSPGKTLSLMLCAPWPFLGLFSYTPLFLVAPFVLARLFRKLQGTPPALLLPDQPTPPRLWMLIPSALLSVAAATKGLGVLVGRPEWVSEAFTAGFVGAGLLFALWPFTTKCAKPHLTQNKLMLVFLVPAPLGLGVFTCLPKFVPVLLAGMAVITGGFFLLVKNKAVNVLCQTDVLHKVLGFAVLPLLGALLMYAPQLEGPLDPFHDSEKWGNAQWGGPERFVHGPIADGGLAQFFMSGDTPLGRMRTAEAMLSALAFGAWLALAGSLLPPFALPWLTLFGVWGFFVPQVPPRFLPAALALTLALHAKRQTWLWSLVGFWQTLAILYSLDTGLAFLAAVLVLLCFGKNLRERSLFFLAGAGGTFLIMKPIFFNELGFAGFITYAYDVVTQGVHWYALPLPDPSTFSWPRLIEFFLMPLTLTVSVFLWLVSRKKQRRLHSRPWVALLTLCFFYGFYFVGRSDSQHLTGALLPFWILLASITLHQLKVYFLLGLALFALAAFPYQGSFRQSHQAFAQKPAKPSILFQGVRIPKTQKAHLEDLAKALEGNDFFDLTGQGLLYPLTRKTPPLGYALSYWAAKPSWDLALSKHITRVERVLLLNRPGPENHGQLDGLYTPLFTPQTSSTVFRHFYPLRKVSGTWLLAKEKPEKIPPTFFAEDQKPLPLGYLPMHWPTPKNLIPWPRQEIDAKEVHTVVLYFAKPHQGGSGTLHWNKRKGVQFNMTPKVSMLTVPVSALPYFVYEGRIKKLSFTGPGQPAVFYEPWKKAAKE